MSVRESNGMPLDIAALVRLSSISNGYNVTQAAQQNGTAYFPNIAPGEYQVEVTAPGYKTAQDQLSVFPSGGTQPVYVYIEPESARGSSAPAGTVMTPKLQAEVDKGLSAMQKKQYEAALQHFSRAEKMAPGNPDILFLLGTAEYGLKNFKEAREEYEKGLGIAPSHPRILLALGEMQLECGDTGGAISTLEKAFATSGADWRAHFLLASAYFRAKDLVKAQAHAERAVTLAKTKGAPAQLLLQQIQAAEAHVEETRQKIAPAAEAQPRAAVENRAALDVAKGKPKGDAALTTLAPDNALAPDNTAELHLAKPERKLPSESVAPTELPTMLAWAPPDTDSMTYQLAPDVSCHNHDVLNLAQKRMTQQLRNFEKFTATEQIEHQEIDSHGVPQEPKFKDFSYLVFVKHSPAHLMFLEETRDGSDGVAGFPTALATTGLVGLGVAILTPEYGMDFEFACEGLSSWRHQAAWQVRFEQKRTVTPRVRTWRKGGTLYAIPLKGRLWIAANSYDLLHLETDLRESIPKLDLTKEHLVIDYGPVPFENGRQRLWLPWKAEMFMELHGHRYHHRHTLANYLLFSVDSQDHVGNPVAKLDEPEQQ